MKNNTLLDTEEQIKFLKRKYLSTYRYYSWCTLGHEHEYGAKYEPREYYACGRHVIQKILRSAQAEGISVEEYVYKYKHLYATTDFYRFNWFIYLKHRQKCHVFNADLRENIRSKDRRKKSRKAIRRIKFLTLNNGNYVAI